MSFESHITYMACFVLLYSFTTGSESLRPWIKILPIFISSNNVNELQNITVVFPLFAFMTPCTPAGMDSTCKTCRLEGKTMTVFGAKVCVGPGSCCCVNPSPQKMQTKNEAVLRLSQGGVTSTAESFISLHTNLSTWIHQLTGLFFSSHPLWNSAISLSTSRVWSCFPSREVV